MKVVSVPGGTTTAHVPRRTCALAAIRLPYKKEQLSSPYPIRLLPPPLIVPVPSYSCRARKKNSSTSSSLQPVLKPSATQEEVESVEEEYEEEEEVQEEDDDDIEMFDDELLEDDYEDFEDDFEGEDVEPYAGDGGEGGGVSLSGTWWDKEALCIAHEVSMSLNGDLRIYAFKTSPSPSICVRIEKLSVKSGSPCMTDIEVFTSAYQARLDEAVGAGNIPENFSLEVSSPGVERVVRIPDDLERFKDRPMYVKYITDNTQESEGIFRLISFDLELGCCTWGVADVRINRERAGKGRPLRKKQREWRLQTPFESLRLVQIYSEC